MRESARERRDVYDIGVLITLYKTSACYCRGVECGK